MRRYSIYSIVWFSQTTENISYNDIFSQKKKWKTIITIENNLKSNFTRYNNNTT